MKKFFKLVAVVLAIAVIICPMMSVVSHATTTGGYKIEAIDDNNLQLTISSTDGFIAYTASVGFNDASAFQSTYSSDGYTNGLKLIGYTTKTATKNSYNTPQISANATGSSLNILVMPTDINNLDLLTEVIIGIRVASNTTASLTKIQAADDGADVTADPTLLSFPAADANTGVIDSTASDYISSNATTNAHTHSFTQQTQSAAYLRTAATCTANATYWYSCATCGLASSTNYFTATGTMLAHTPDNTETFVKADATCTEDAQYYQECSVCNQQLSTYWTKPNTALGHSMTYHAATSSTCEYQGNDAYYSCSRCNKLFGDSAGANEVTLEEVTRALADHTASNTKTNLKTAATCTADAVYYQQCSVCGIKLNTTWTDTGSKLPHTVVEDAAVPATCTATGLTTGSHCSVCNTVLVAQETVPAKGHTAGEAVVENNVAATCTTAGSYDTVVYCSVCDAEISRETVNVPATGHTPATAVEENRVEATCGVDGSYDSVVYCSVCHAEISRTPQTIPATGAHTYTYTSNGDGTHTVGCANCDYSAQEDCDTAGTDGACSKCGYKAAPAEPPVIDTITFTSKSIGLANTAIQFSFRVRQSILDAYANFDMVLVPNKYDTSTFNQVANPETVVIPKASWSIVGGGTKFYSYSYNDIQLYEVGLGIEYYIRVYDEGGNIIGTSAKTTVVPSEAAKALILSSSKPALQTAFTDLLVACNEAKKAFATAGSDLEAAEPFIDENDADGIIKYASKGDVDVSRLNVHDSFENQNDAFSTASSAAHRFVTTVSIAKVPVLNYRIKNNPSASDALDTSKLVMTISYTSTDGSEHEKVVSGDMWVQSGSFLTFAYDEVGLHDSSAVITAVCTYDGAAAFTKEYNFDTHYSTRMSSGASAAMFTAFAKLGLSFPATMA